MTMIIALGQKGIMMDDLISRQAAIEELMEHFKRVPTTAIRAKKVIEELPSAQPEQRWIPCSERLPKDEIAYYLVTLVDYSQLTYRDRDTDIARWDYDRRKGPESWHWCKEREVIAWMPLPEPYRGEGK